MTITQLIFLTIGLTLLGAGLIVYLILLGLRSRKLNSFKKTIEPLVQQIITNMDNIRSELNNKIEESDNALYDKINDVDEQLVRQIQINVDGISSNIDDIHKRIDETYVYTTNKTDELNRKFDSRIDKLSAEKK